MVVDMTAVLAVLVAEIVLKLGTLAPDGSTFHRRLKELGEGWRDASGGEVRLRVYPSGVAGDEPDMVRKMRIGQLSGGMFTVLGMREIFPTAQVFTTPQLVTSDEELDALVDRFTPGWDRELDALGFVVLHWAEAGTVYFFTRAPAPTPADLATQKLFSWSSDRATQAALKRCGFLPVVLSPTDILPSLHTGIIDAFNAPPLAALGLRWYEPIGYLTDFRWAKLIGATLVRKEDWERIPAALRPKLLEIARRLGRTLTLDVRREEASAITEMVRHGLHLVPVGPAEAAQWRAAAARAWPVVRGELVPEAVFDDVAKFHAEWMKSHPQ